MKCLRKLPLLLVLLLIPVIPAHADTGADPLRITDQPAQLILQLGPGFAGTQFELRTDAGVYPQPVVVSADGVLRMDLGGSKTYTLSPMKSSQVSATAAPTTAEDVDLDGFLAGLTEPGAEVPATTAAPQEAPVAQGVPTKHIVLFGGGILAAVIALIVLSTLKKRRPKEGYDDEYGDEI